MGAPAAMHDGQNTYINADGTFKFDALWGANHIWDWMRVLDTVHIG
jgi:hypothetical protein